MEKTIEEKKQYLIDILPINTFKNISELGIIGNLIINYYYFRFTKVFARIQ